MSTEIETRTDKAIELQAKAHAAFVTAGHNVVERVREGRSIFRDDEGQVTAEWLMLMVGIIALAGVLAGAGIWQDVGKKIASVFNHLLDNVQKKSDNA